VLDAYAGSGALGFEALSRGARQAVFLESDRRAWLVLRANAATLRLQDRCTILRGRAVELIRGAAVQGPFELVLADPPYAAGEAAPFLPLAAGLVGADGRIVLEREAGSPPPVAASAGLEHYRTAGYGRTCLDFFRPLRSGPAPLPDG
jgi:16S rRNA (guanine966-N2)-methyltransferase